MYNHLNLSKFLLIIFLISTLISCGEESSDKNSAEYDQIGFWTLRGDNSTILLDDSISYEGDSSIKTANKDCTDSRLTTNFPVEENEDYEISVAVRLQHSNFKKKAGVTIHFENGLAVLVTQADNVILSQTANI